MLAGRTGAAPISRFQAGGFRVQFACEVKDLDVSEFVAEQWERLSSGGVPALVTPREQVYRPADPGLAVRLRLAE